MGVGSGGQEGRAPLDFHTWYRYRHDSAIFGLFLLFFVVFFCYFSVFFSLPSPLVFFFFSFPPFFCSVFLSHEPATYALCYFFTSNLPSFSLTICCTLFIILSTHFSMIGLIPFSFETENVGDKLCLQNKFHIKAYF